jgi:hypothetical protein
MTNVKIINFINKDTNNNYNNATQILSIHKRPHLIGHIKSEVTVKLNSPFFLIPTWQSVTNHPLTHFFSSQAWLPITSFHFLSRNLFFPPPINLCISLSLARSQREPSSSLHPSPIILFPLRQDRDPSPLSFSSLWRHLKPHSLIPFPISPCIFPYLPGRGDLVPSRAAQGRLPVARSGRL